MMIQQTIEIPASRKVRFDVALPETAQCGKAPVSSNEGPGMSGNILFDSTAVIKYLDREPDFQESGMNRKDILLKLDGAGAGELFSSLYGEERAASNRKRYRKLVEELPSPQADPNDAEDIRLYTAPGRTEMGGNHTDHNHGKILAASIHLDIAAAAFKRRGRFILFRSTGFPDVTVDIDDLRRRPEEEGTTGALIRGVASAFAERGTHAGGCTINADSMVFPGSGLSSSAALEALIGKIIDDLYGEGRCPSLEIAKIGRYAENVFFGKPCGLMDQIACATGGVVSVDFADNKNPLVETLDFDPAASGFLLCIVNTRGSHADRTPDYAAVPQEMKSVARFFGKTVLREVAFDDVIFHGNEIREKCGDRALLRAMHYFNENRRVEAMGALLGKISRAPSTSHGKAARDTGRFLELVNESGDSSWELLQNIYSENKTGEQGLSLALALTRDFLQRYAKNDKTHPGACRVHGGGFAGTIQAYIPKDAMDGYTRLMERYFGAGSVTALRIRPTGAARLPLLICQGALNEKFQA
jgi:galactokinase